MQRRESTARTIAVAAVLCIVCSLAVSAAAVVLRPYQEANAQLDMQKNILDAAGLAIGEYGRTAGELNKKQIDELYGWVSEELVNLDTGEVNTEMNPEDWNLVEAARDPKTSVKVVDPEFDFGEATRQSVSKIYYVKRPGSDKIQQVVLPVHGKGLWGTLYGYLALKSDLETIQGLTFYQHKETPGLGGEVDNPDWKAQWDGRKLYNEKGEPQAYVYKGPTPDDNVYAVDGLSGATITSNGVTKLIRYWASNDGYAPFLRKLADRMDVPFQGPEPVPAADREPASKIDAGREASTSNPASQSDHSIANRNLGEKSHG